MEQHSTVSVLALGGLRNMAVAKLERHNLAGKSVSDMGHISSVFGL